MCWEFFDKTYCISLDERSDRREEAKAQFKAVGLLERVEFVIINKHPFDCEQGVYESHMLCMKKGLHANAASMVIRNRSQGSVFRVQYRSFQSASLFRPLNGTLRGRPSHGASTEEHIDAASETDCSGSLRFLNTEHRTLKPARERLR